MRESNISLACKPVGADAHIGPVSILGTKRKNLPIDVKLLQRADVGIGPYGKR